MYNNLNEEIMNIAIAMRELSTNLQHYPRIRRIIKDNGSTRSFSYWMQKPRTIVIESKQRG